LTNECIGCCAKIITHNADSLTPVTRSNDGAGNGDKADVLRLVLKRVAVEIETLTNKYKNGNKNIWRVDYQR